MSVCLILLCLILHRIIPAASDGTSSRVTEMPKEVTVTKGGNVTWACRFSIFQDVTCVTVRWWKQGKSEYVQDSGDGRKRFGLETKWYSTFQLLNITFQDSGVYHCTVMCHGIIQGNGTGSKLIVHVPPTPLKIVSRPSEGNSTVSLNLVCETAPFFPQNFSLTWYKNGAETGLEAHNTIEKSTDGLYKVSSILSDVKQTEDNYTCMVSHMSLKIPAVVTYTVTKFNEDNVVNSLYFWLPGCVVIGMIFLVPIIAISRRGRLQNNEYKEDYLTGSNRREVSRELAEDVHYSAVEVNKPRKSPTSSHDDERTVYGRIQQATG